MYSVSRIVFLACLFLIYSGVSAQSVINNYIFFNMDRERIHDESFLAIRQIKGAQLKYTWKELEPEKGKYNLDLIECDLNFLKEKGKKLFIQIQDVSFDSLSILIPKYLLNDSIYHGGANSQYNFFDDNEERYEKAGWVARRWDSNVSERFHLLLKKLGEKFDGQIDGINLPETAVDFGSKRRLYPPGFTFEGYKNAIKENMRIAKKAFPKSVVIQYINFMPGEWLPYDDHFYTRDLFAYAKKNKIGVGGPDLFVYKKGQMDNSYVFIKDCANIIPTGIAIQEGNYEHVNPQTGKQVSISDIYSFAKDYLKLNYLFWCTEEPYYSSEVLPFLKTVNN